VAVCVRPQICNGYPSPVCLGGDGFHVGREAAFGAKEGPSVGQLTRGHPSDRGNRGVTPSGSASERRGPIRVLCGCQGSIMRLSSLHGEGPLT
jgi:hypothetical protein